MNKSSSSRKKKIVRKGVVPGGPGSVKFSLEDSDDFWLAYNLISPGDTVMATTVRKTFMEKASGREAERVKLILEIQVQDIDYQKAGSVIRVRGMNVLENEHVKIGAFHTLKLEPHRPFVLRKLVWDPIALDVLDQAEKPAASADLAVVLMQEGLAHIFLVGKSMTTTCRRIETSIPRKHGSGVAAGYQSALDKFFDNVTQAFLKHVDFSVVRCAVIASPGFTKDQFHRRLLLEAERKNIRPIIENKSRVVLVQASSGYKHSLSEVLGAPNVMSLINNTKAAEQVRALKDFFDMLSKDPHRACYGRKHVEVAHELLAIQTLLIADNLFRNPDVAVRQKYVDFVNSVRSMGGNAHIFSSMHASGEQLEQLTGIAAILRFPLPDLDDIEV